MANPPEETYPRDPLAYECLRESEGFRSRVLKVKLKNSDTVLACRVIDTQKVKGNDLKAFKVAAEQAVELQHPNILSVHTSFTDKSEMRILMPFVQCESLGYIRSNYLRNGIPLDYVAVILKEILKALIFLHEKGFPHKGVKANNIFFNNGHVQLSDFNTSSSVYLESRPLVNILYWRAPEIPTKEELFTFKSDIWAIGITALELAHSKPPLSLRVPYPYRRTRTKSFSFSDYRKNNPELILLNLSESFLKMVEWCLNPEPNKRPSAAELLENEFFSNPNLPTTQEIFLHINQVMLGIAEHNPCQLISPIAPPVPVQNSPSTVDNGGRNESGRTSPATVVQDLNQMLSQTAVHEGGRNDTDRTSPATVVHDGGRNDTDRTSPATVVQGLNQVISQTEDMSRAHVNEIELEEIQGQLKLLDNLSLLQANMVRDLGHARELLDEWGSRIQSQINKRKLDNIHGSASESRKKKKHRTTARNANNTQNPASPTTSQP